MDRNRTLGAAEAERAVVIQELADGGHVHGTRYIALVRRSSQPHRRLSASGASMFQAGAAAAVIRGADRAVLKDRPCLASISHYGVGQRTATRLASAA